MKKSSKKPQEGDVFVLQPVIGKFYFGKVIQTDLKSLDSFINGMCPGTTYPPTIFHTVVHLHEMYISSNMRCTFQTTRDVHLMQVERIVQANVFHWFTNLNLLQARQKISFISR